MTIIINIAKVGLEGCASFKPECVVHKGHPVWLAKCLCDGMFQTFPQLAVF